MSAAVSVRRQATVAADLIVHSRQPLNAEPPLERLATDFITPAADLYIRCHGEIPNLDEARHQLRVDGGVVSPLDFSMQELRQRFPRQSVTAVLQCAGNRRGDLNQAGEVSGDPWSAGAIGNAVWTGVSLADVLRAARIRRDGGSHVTFSACDLCNVDDEEFRYAASIPMERAMAGGVVLAYEMNGAPLAPEHGYPLRVIVPGFAGARSVKWLSGITVQSAPSNAKPQARDYKLFPPDVSQDTVDWKTGITINAMPLNAAICEPTAGSHLRAGPATIRGYAIATEREIVRVDVSLDGGRTWHQAELAHDASAPWSWTLWHITLTLPPTTQELVVRAWDSAGQTQPALPQDTWNFKGYVNASWHRVPVTVTAQGSP